MPGRKLVRAEVIDVVAEIAWGVGTGSNQTQQSVGFESDGNPVSSCEPCSNMIFLGL